MEAAFWQQRWVDGQIGFHEAEPHALLRRFWPQLGLAKGARVLVPLCGKSHDLSWLAAAGCEVVGIELSPIAVSAFFTENGLEAELTPDAKLVRYHAAGLTVYCGDFFDLTPAALGPFDAIYDRAALIALPPAMREAYAAHLSMLAPAAARQLLITVEYDPQAINPPPFVVQAADVEALYADHWSLAHLHSASADIKGAPGIEHVFVLERRA